MKLSKYLKMSVNKDKCNRMEWGIRELRKLEWDMKDASIGGMGDKSKRNGRVGSLKGNR